MEKPAGESQDTQLEKYLYQDKQYYFLSVIGAYAAHFYDRTLSHGPIIFSGLDKLKQAEPNVIAPTHQSAFDISAVGWATQKAKLNPPSYIAKVNLVVERPVSGRLMPYAGAFYIEQTKRDQPYIESHAQRTIASGRSLVYFPEGRRRPIGADINLERGLGITAVRLGLSVSPVGIYGTEITVDDGRPRVGVVVGDEIHTEGNPLKFRNRLKKELIDLRNQAKELAGY